MPRAKRQPAKLLKEDLRQANSTPKSVTAPSTPRAKRQRLHDVNNGVKGRDQDSSKPVQVSAALKKAIDTMDHMRLRLWVKHYCETMQPLRADLEKSLLVTGKNIVRYHADSDSENEESGGDEKVVQHIMVGDEELTPRYVMCENCKHEFDATSNDRGDCVWHPGAKERDEGASVWDDLEEYGHDLRKCEEDDYYAEGFRWSCCGEEGDHNGCKSTKHKSEVNIVIPVESQKPIMPPATKSNRKRKAPEGTQKPVSKRASRR
ncbi:hypothetical protein V8E51_007617 [Hyaloscypha variabilis]